MDQEKVWDKIARPWREFRQRIPPTVEEFITDKSGKILDVGCGAGRNFRKVEGLEWYGVDFSQEMLNLAEEYAEKSGIDIVLKKAPAEDLPFEDDYFDAVMMYAVIHCIDSTKKREKALREIYRVLRPGAEAIISSWGPKSPRLKNKEKECYVPWTSRDGKDRTERYTYIYDLKEMEDLVKSVGFEIVRSWEEKNVNVIVRKPKN